ncbi:MAG: hypothetical protein RIF33_20005 [Cyclobacteriaceae bacterium]
MLSRKLGYILIAMVTLSSILAVIIIQFYDVEILKLLLALTFVHFVALLVFIIDIYRNSSVPYRWVWIVLMIMAPIIVMIAYTITYIPDAVSRQAKD